MKSGEGFEQRIEPSMLCFHQFEQGNKQAKFSCGEQQEMLEAGCMPIMPWEEVRQVINMKSVKLNVKDVHCYSLDKIKLIANCNVEIEVSDPEKAIFKVNNVLSAIQFFASSAIRTAIGKLEFEIVKASKKEVKEVVVPTLKSTLKSWGIKMKEFEIKGIEIYDQRINTAMNLRNKAEQDEQRIIKESEAEKNVKMNEARAMQYELQKKADGEARMILNQAEGIKNATIKSAQGLAESMQVLIDKAQNQGGMDVLKLRIKQEYIDQMGELSKSSANQNVLNFDFTDIKSFINISDSMI